jgi:hypothetical protein
MRPEEPGMSWDSKNEGPTRTEYTGYFCHRPRVVVDMLQYI